MNILDYAKDRLVFLDGGMGTLLQARGLKPGESPALWNLTHPEDIIDIQKSYYDAGSNVVCSNTFEASNLKYDSETLDKIIGAAISCAREAARRSDTPQEKFVALDLGPTGKLLKPYGEFDFEDAVAVFAENVRLGVKHGADFVIIETMNDSYETKAALLAVKENCDLPVFVSNVYGEDGKLMTGASPEAMVAMIEGMGANALGANCSLGPKQLKSSIARLCAAASVPVLVKPNGGLPKSIDGQTMYDLTPEEFAQDMLDMIALGARIVGGCCGTTPAHIAALTEAAKDVQPASVTHKETTLISSYTHAVEIGKKPILIGERINPTGKKRFKQALQEHDIAYILQEGVAQQDKGVQVLDVNVGLPGIDEPEMLKTAVCELQAVIDLPLQIDTSDVEAMEIALRRYNGKALVNSVNGKAENMAAIFPLVKKYGGVVVALTLDEDGIPGTVEGRFAIAKKILSTAATYGINKKDIIFDTLCMAASADATGPEVTLGALERISTELGSGTVLGVSNVSFGLPRRDIVNAFFFAQALDKGLSAAIINPFAEDMLKAYHVHNLIHQLDENCAEYIAFAEGLAGQVGTGTPADVTDLKTAIIKGLGEAAEAACKSLLETESPLAVVDSYIIPALDEVGKGFEEKRVYLPQLLMSAEAAKCAFEVIKTTISQSGEQGESKGKFVIATVQGDIHDIGKNIVKVLLENYGYDVIDLGKDVAPQTVVDAVVSANAPLCGLSALMTTTVPAMEATIIALREQAPWCKVVVGGAVLNEEYAAAIGADKYGADAMATVRYAEEVMAEK